MKEGLFVFVVLAALSLVPSMSRAEDESAWEQLQDATSGYQSTGETFDGSAYPLPSDAYPYGNVYVPEVESSPVDTSTGTTGGYDVDTSTSGYDTSGYDWGTSTESSETGYDTSGYDTGGYDVDTSTGSYDTGSYDTGYETGGYGEESAE